MPTPIPQAPTQVCTTCSLQVWSQVPTHVVGLSCFKCDNCGVPFLVPPPLGPQFVQIVITNLDTLSYNGQSVIVSASLATMTTNIANVVNAQSPGLYTITSNGTNTVRIQRNDNNVFSALVYWKKLDATQGNVTLTSNGVNTAP